MTDQTDVIHPTNPTNLTNPSREADGDRPPAPPGPPADVEAAERFVHANGRLLERRRLAHLRHGAPAAPVVDVLRTYRNADGGFGHALEPDVRAPDSEPVSTSAALDVLEEVEPEENAAGRDPMVAEAAAWVATIAGDDGGVPFVLPTAAAYPHAPWMVPSEGGSHLTLALTAAFIRAGLSTPWLERATDWCWTRVEAVGQLSGYWVKFGLDFLDAVPGSDQARATAAIEAIRPRLRPDGSIPVPGGLADERITPLRLSPRPAARSRALFSESAIAADLDALERGQQDDGGWTFDFLAWSPGQLAEWRGRVTLDALITLAAHGRIPPTEP